LDYRFENDMVEIVVPLDSCMVVPLMMDVVVDYA
jgi:hypothetical protein